VGERDLQHPLHALAEAGGMIGEEAGRDGRVALLFGSEKTGLSNDELSYCHWLLTIPMAEHAEVRHPSMNLGQAVAVCLYELVRQADLKIAGGGESAAAESGELERLTGLLTDVLEATGYTKRHPSNCDEGQIRRLVLRMGLRAEDVKVWMGILRQVLWKVRGGAS
jgi:tRNA C32,U32 (ribose-2'-O)-methylase TrmJ